MLGLNFSRGNYIVYISNVPRALDIAKRWVVSFSILWPDIGGGVERGACNINVVTGMSVTHLDRGFPEINIKFRPK